MPAVGLNLWKCGMPLFGAHQSIAGGYHNALLAARARQCDTVQLFTKNNTQWRAKDIAAAFCWKPLPAKARVWGIASSTWRESSLPSRTGAAWASVWIPVTHSPPDMASGRKENIGQRFARLTA